MLSDKTLEVLKGGTQGEWCLGKDAAEYMIPVRTDNIERRCVAWVDALGGHARILPIEETKANARKIALVNPMARVCEAAAELRRAEVELERLHVEGMEPQRAFWKELDKRTDAVTVGQKALDAALSNLEAEARKHG